MPTKRDLLLIHAPFKPFALGKQWTETNSLAPPLGVMYLSAPLIKAGYQVKFIDLNVDHLSEKDFTKLVKSYRYIGISCYSDTLQSVRDIIKYVRKIRKKAYILVGGPYCTITRNYVEGADLVTIGEAEKYILDIIQRLDKKQSLKDIPGLYLRQGKQIIKQPGLMKVDNLNQSLIPDLSITKGKNYGHFYGLKIDNLTGIMSSRGCSFHCSFCTCRGIGYRERSVDNVMDEIKMLVSNGYKYISFYDDNFLANKSRVIDLMNRIITQKIKVKMFCQGRVDSTDRSFYQLLRKAGVILIMFGIESANQDVLDYFNKLAKVETIKKAVTLTNETGILSFGHIIIGAPMETQEYFDHTSQFVDDIKLDFMNLNILGYYQGSTLWKDKVEQGIIKPQETIVWANEKLSLHTYQQLLNIKDKMNHRFYTNPLRFLRIVKKIIATGEFPLFFKFMIKINKNFFKLINNPFTPKKEFDKITTSIHA